MAPHAPAAELDSLLTRVGEIAPVLHDHSAEADRERQLSPPVIQAMLDAGLFAMSRPRERGGLELDPVSSFRVVEEVSRLDSAAGWNLNLSVALGYVLAWLPDDGAEEILGTPELILAGVFFPSGQAVPVTGGYRLDGRWRFVSGCRHARWILVAAVVKGDGGPTADAGGAGQQLFMFLPAGDMTVIDTWHTLGMRGTGSHDVRADDAFVPAHRTAPMAPLREPGKAFTGPLYRLTVWPPIALLAPPALGIARAAIGDIVDVARSKTPAYTGAALRDRQVVQRQVAEAEACLGAGRAYLHDTFSAAWEAAVGHEAIDLSRKLRMQLSATHAVQCAARAVDLVHAAAGASGIRDEIAFQRYFRDVHTITQHAFISAQRYESVGAEMLGGKCDWPFFAF